MLAAMKMSVMADITDIANDANWGFMLGQFKWVYAIFSPLGGYIADRFSRRFTICASLFIWSIVTWTTANATTYDELLWTRSLMGISEAFYIPAILKDKFPSIGQGMAGVSATLYVNIAPLMGAFGGGWLADRLMRGTIRRRIYVSALGMSLLIPALFGVGNSPTLLVAIMFLALFGLGWGFFDCNNMPILSQIVRPELRATGYGIMNLVSISCGGLADWGFGILRDQAVPLNQIFGVFSSLALFSVVLVLFIRPRADLAQRELELSP